MRNTRLKLLIGILLWAPVLLHAQPEINSPFSRFGLGDLSDQNFTALYSMGGLAASYADRYHANLVNPAGLSALRATAFEVGVHARYSIYEGTTTSDNIWSGNISNLALSFPLRNPVNQALDRKVADLQWGMSLALVPYSVVGYNIQNERNLPGTGEFFQFNEGEGGTYRFIWGNGWQYNNISVGLNLGYLFGQIETEKRVVFGDLEASYANLVNRDISFGGVIWNFGAQYNLVLKEESEGSRKTREGINFGFHLQPSNGFNTNTEKLVRRGRDFSFQIFDYVNVDTISYQPDVEQEGELPVEWGFGAMYYVSESLKLGLNYKASNWSEYRNEAKPEAEPLENAWRLSIGGEWIPDVLSYNNYFERARYRTGIYYGKDPRSIDGEQISEWGFRVGTGFPIILQQQQISFIDVGMEIAQRKTDAFQETYFRVRLGLTLNNDRWFLKRRFN